MTEDDIPDEMVKLSQALALTICNFVAGKATPPIAIVSIGMAAAYVITNMDLVDGVTTDEVADDLAEAVKDYIKDILEAEKEKH